jgi:hypothetical protein
MTVRYINKEPSTIRGEAQDGEMALRWAAAGMEASRSQFRRVKGYRQLPQLAAALERATADEPGLLDLRVTA